MPVLLQIALGGALGAVARYVSVRAFARLFGEDFPWGTLAVNVGGGFVMGVVAALMLERPDLGLQRAAPFLLPGVLGGFTTFSAFSLETVQLAESGRIAAAAGYVAASVALSLVALALGLRLARCWGGAA